MGHAHRYLAFFVMQIDDKESSIFGKGESEERWDRRREADIFSLSKRVAYSDQSSNPECCFSMMEQVRLCAVFPMENWLGTSKTTYRVGWMIWICYSHSLERRCLKRGGGEVAPFFDKAICVRQWLAPSSLHRLIPLKFSRAIWMLIIPWSCGRCGPCLSYFFMLLN